MNDRIVAGKESFRVSLERVKIDESALSSIFKMSWTLDSEERLISLIADRPAIWNKTDGQHTNSYYLNKQWKVVIDTIEKPSKLNTYRVTSPVVEQAPVNEHLL